MAMQKGTRNYNEKGSRNPDYAVKCAQCGCAQPDRGLRATCQRCGCSPVPSYHYPEGSSFHPATCGCEVGASRIVVPIQQRHTEVPSIIDQLKPKRRTGKNSKK